MPAWNTTAARSTRHRPATRADPIAERPTTSANPPDPSGLSCSSMQPRMWTVQSLYDTSKPVTVDLSSSSPISEFSGSAFALPIELPDADADPISPEAALAGPDSNLWHAAMSEELASLHRNRTWSLVPLPEGRQPITCKWIIRRKLHPDGSIARYKARLVARGFSQIPGLDYGDTFSPVLRMSSFRLLLAMAAQFDFELYQLDVQTAFLHGDLSEELYMQQPPLFESSEYPHHVCRLHRSIYGLKQSPRLWFQRFNDFMLAHGYTRLLSEPYIYIRHTPISSLIIALYVDDIPVAGSSKSVVLDAIAEIKSVVPITDLAVTIKPIWSMESTITSDVGTSKGTYLLCHHSVCSSQAAQWLQTQGFRRLYNIARGIHEYSIRVDNSVPTY
ncbi:hypothetical protein L7F22_030545 [Adiantum nelumboides]|nr:hypothetical protein [Adiantum nelumboides]